jgi:hypothetical protein
MDTDDYRRTFAEFLATQPVTSDVTYEQVAEARTREDLGISSLNMIQLLVNYIEERTNNTVTLRPEWVSRLTDMDGIVAVLREIDASSLAEARTT